VKEIKVILFGAIKRLMEKTVASVFPGQGAQKPGMGKDYYDNVNVSRQIYEEASDALGWDVAGLCFSDDERLNLTEYTQPCILTTEIAALRGLQSLYGFSPTIFGGHSLGEFTALVAADVLPLAEALRIVHIRGQLMQKAVPVGIGGMAAVISQNLNLDVVRENLTDIPLDVANANSANQVVISGALSALPEAEKRLQNAFAHDQGFRFVPLNVSAPFHSRFMKPIEESFADALRNLGKNIVPGNAPKVTSNFSGQFHSDSTEDIMQCLVFQLSKTVRWIDNMKCIAAKADMIYEIGPGRPLRDFFKTIDVSCTSITTLAAAERTFLEN
jgi:[acyl-carrier-protein] S-malonyltransferase/trans-AT polyketide synthase/acyltransferase/oxidoreductase domain-containing protein